MIFNGLLAPSLLGYVLLTLLLTHLTIVSVTVYLHRHQAHRAIELHPILSHFFRFWLWLTTGMVTREWVAIHRKHHAKCETEDDPHSPQTRGLAKVVWQGAELYREASHDQQMLERYGQGTPDDWLERRLYQRHSVLGITLLAATELLLFGPAGLAIWAVQMAWIPFWAAGVINGIGHFWGYRNFELPNAATNIVPWGILVGGEELHNNHHAFGSSAKFSNRWWEFDLGWWYIRLFQFLGLARVLKRAPRRQLVAERPALDQETIKALTVNRLQLFRDYQRQVLRPVFRTEIGQAQRQWRKAYRYARRLAWRDRSLLNERDRERLSETLNNSSALDTVYQFKIRLQQIWEKNSGGHERRLEALRLWCEQAEASGVAALQEFVHLLRRYSLAPAH